MDEPQSPAPSSRVKPLVYFFAALVGLLVLYQGVMWGVREYTTGLIHDVAGRNLPDFELEDLSGREFSARGLRGKTVVLNFFRSNCHNCREERDDIKRLARELDQERVVLLGIMVDRVQGFPPELTAKTLAESGYEHPVLMADEAFVNAFHGVGWANITPVTYVADDAGVIIGAFRHPYRMEDLLSVLP